MDRPYVGENTVRAIIKNIKNLFAELSNGNDDVYLKKEEIENLEFITTADIDEICGATIQMASEVMF